MTPNAKVFQGGFADPVFDAQMAFKSAMDAMARPGTPVTPEIRIAPPAPLNPVAAMLALAVCDADTNVFLGPDLRKDTIVADWLRFHTGTEITEERMMADFAIVNGTQAVRGFEMFCLGTQDYPDRSTTLIVQVDGFDDQPVWDLSGPGIKTVTAFSPAGGDEALVIAWQRNHALFPRGVDVFFAAPDRLAALPRSTQLALRKPEPVEA